MGIFKTILGGLGFKQENEIENEKNIVRVQNDNSKVLPIKDNKVVENENKNLSVQNLVCYKPKTNKDVKLLIDCLKRGEACIVNLAELGDNDKICVLDYLGGAVYALAASLSRLQGDLYVMSPCGVKITTM